MYYPKSLSLFFPLLFLSISTFACTTFVLQKDSSLVFGRNLDWVSDDGALFVNRRNVKKTALVFPPERPVSWTSKYGSVSFNQFDKEFPFGGINEKGLVVEIMLVPGNYPKRDKRPVLNELQWIQYQLDNSMSIEEVIASDKFIRISKVNQNLHFLICDKNGNTAVIEFTRKGMLVYKGEDLPIPVLENDSYYTSLEKNKNNQNCRFKTASNLLSKYDSKNNSPIDYSFEILDKVALDGSWSIVYDIKKMEIHFRTASQKSIRKILVNEFDFSCNGLGKLYDLKKEDKGNVNTKFQNYSDEVNKGVLKAALKSNGIRFEEYILDRFLNYAGTCICLG